ncbi:hypothetical protein ZOSMA_113G00390 [Zostera marina]|uniref:Protein kinase domain-containing protein n=1 Tax=Zostera marina TaxID=29655 RepID=A0A0K9Q2M3_ZOSMR|nr:hypothetical protein ZOSMA_113G00390 [Zostera marina]
MRTLIVNGRSQSTVFHSNASLSHYLAAAAEAASSSDDDDDAASSSDDDDDAVTSSDDDDDTATSSDDDDDDTATSSDDDDTAAASSDDDDVVFEEEIAGEYEDYSAAAYEDDVAAFDDHVTNLFEEATAVAASSTDLSSSAVYPAVASSSLVDDVVASAHDNTPVHGSEDFSVKIYEQLSIIRYGKDCVVTKAREKTTGTIVAVKRFMKNGWGYPKSTAQDISLFKSLLDSKYMAKLLDVGREMDVYVYFIFEYLQYNLKEAMSFHNTEMLTFDSRPETAERIRILMYQLCKAILYLHDNGIIHSALRPDNILVDMMTYRLKIADFNPGKTFNIIHNQREDIDKILGFKYIPPEILLGAPHSTQGDMWNVGLIFAELLRGRKLFDAHAKVTSKAEQLKIIFCTLGTPTEETWPRVGKIMSKYNYYKREPFIEIIPAAGKYGFDLLMKMLYYDPSRRISAKEALDHSYFNSIDKSEFN